jgi:hypothetical protein
MKYVPPYGVSDPNASYINGDPSQGLKGSIPPAAVFEEPQREIVNMINYSSYTPSDADLTQLLQAIRSQFVNTVVDTGTVNYLSVTTNPPLQAYTRGLLLRVLVANNNSGPCTIDAGCGRVNVNRVTGASLASGDLVAGGLYDMGYDGTNFQLLNFMGTGAVGDVHNYYLNIPYAVDTSTTPNIVTANFSPALATMVAGQPILVKIANNNTGATKINVNVLAPITMKALDGGDLLPDDIITGGIYLMVSDGTNLYIAPSNVILNNVTFNIPSTQFNTPQALLDAIQRKLIAPGKKVTIQLASGKYVPITVNHPSANGICIKGTMLGNPPTLGNFSVGGSSAASRASDGAFNLNVLRSRFGTEIQIPPSGGIGIHVGYGAAPTIQDLLITTGNSSATNNQTYGIYNNSVVCSNVAVWGCHGGFVADPDGNFVLFGCFAITCYFGFCCEHGGIMGMQYGGPLNGWNYGLGCDVAGFCVDAFSYMLINSTYARGNGYYGYYAVDSSEILGSSSDAIYNGSIDCYAANLSEISIVNRNIYSYSPAINSIGNNGALMLIS